MRFVKEDDWGEGGEEVDNEVEAWESEEGEAWEKEGVDEEEDCEWEGDEDRR